MEQQATTSSPPVRVGVILDTLRPPAWIRDLLSQIETADFASLEAAVVVPPRERPAGLGRRLLRVVEALDARVFRARPNAFGRAELRVGGCGRKLISTSSAGDVAPLLSRLDLDVVLAFGVATDGLEGCARHGVWSVVFADRRDYDETPAYFWEVHDGSAVAGVVLRMESPAGRRILYRSYSPTVRVSLHRNRNVAAWKAVRATLLRLRELHAVGSESLLAHADDDVPARAGRGERAVHVRSVVWAATRMLGDGLRRFLEWRLQRGEWFVAYRRREGWPPWSSATSPRLLAQEHGRFLADPFLIERDGRHFLFVEDFRDSLGKAVISSVELGPEGPIDELQVVLEHEQHVSYPFVFERGGDVYMIPETSATRGVELYRANPFPHRWTFERLLISDLVADDATLLHHESRVWLFVNVAPDGTSPLNGELFLFWTDALESEWTPHPWNPIVADVRFARPAGRIFHHEGALIRPSQDCSVRYGYATVFNRIETLTEREYREVAIARIGPEWLPGNLGTHTYSCDGTYEAVDGYRQLWRRPFARRRP